MHFFRPLAKHLEFKKIFPQLPGKSTESKLKYYSMTISKKSLQHVDALGILEDNISLFALF